MLPLESRRDPARAPGHHVVIARQDRVLGRAEATGDVAVEPVEAVVLRQRPPGQPREVALEHVAQQDDLVVPALEVLEELAEAGRLEVLRADVQVGDDGDAHGRVQHNR